MSLDMQKKSSFVAPDEQTVVAPGFSWASLFRSWELYLILLVAGFLRLYQLNTTEFDGDQADIFAMAHNAVSHGHLVATSNIASIKIFNPPAIIYALMVPAAFSANPLWGAVLTAVLAIAAVVLTYILTCRYYGRLAGTLTGMLYAVAAIPIFYSRFMWNQNMLLFFVPLLIWFLFRGAVAHRPNWLFPSVILVALLVQFHASSIVLAAPLLVALLLAPRKTLRWYDLLLSALGVLFLYSTYIVWLFQTHFKDISTLLNTAKGQSLIDAQALIFYLQFLGPLPDPLTNNKSVLFPYLTAFSWILPLMVLLLIAGIVLAVIKVVVPQPDSSSVSSQSSTTSGRQWGWWKRLRQSPLSCGLLILLVWQIVPLLYLTRHDIVLHLHYFIMFMPGPFILIGVFLATLLNWLRIRVLAWLQGLRMMLILLCAVLIGSLGLTSLGYVYDASHGRYVDTTWAGQYYNDLASLQKALHTADLMAQQRHLNHIYVSADLATQSAFAYLAGQTNTPTTVVDDTCLVLPGSQYGAAMLLTAPHSHRLDLVVNYAHAPQVGTSPHPGGPAFNLYVLQPGKVVTPLQDDFTQGLSFVDAHSFNNGKQGVLATRWKLPQSESAGQRISYNYSFAAYKQDTNSAPMQQRTCSFSALRAGDEIVVPLGDPAQAKTSMQVKTFTTLPTTLSYNVMGAFPLQFDTFQQYDAPGQQLRTKSGRAYIPILAGKK
ncbi:hypothetical protein KDA_34530 [Dictyobacter alpinus]|uniref:Glycosyltransferase RgtA/B/C/D-like domain-containing protein n=1 Tax=Dictyobacter alpinus TaxID=2014873 RepID=A0A402B9I0_9CHLR|nr:glycosyltransferase family 39 protein [Dictyobacter alpinus]GCE27969.1 hypothetical protein KDA_34530 [Dictyobacter alpinus]